MNKYFSNLFVQTLVVLPFLPDEGVLHPRPAAHLPLVEAIQDIHHPGAGHHLVISSGHIVDSILFIFQSLCNCDYIYCFYILEWIHFFRRFLHSVCFFCAEERKKAFFYFTEIVSNIVFCHYPVDIFIFIYV